MQAGWGLVGTTDPKTGPVQLSDEGPLDVRGLETRPSGHAKRLHIEYAEACDPDAPAQNTDFLTFSPASNHFSPASDHLLIP